MIYQSIFEQKFKDFRKIISIILFFNVLIVCSNILQTKTCEPSLTMVLTLFLGIDDWTIFVLVKIDEFLFTGIVYSDYSC